jgi:concentrative nucleoside transporter, CNT family
MLEVGRSLIGIAVLLLIAFAISMNRKAIKPRIIIAALLTQISIGVKIFY